MKINLDKAIEYGLYLLTFLLPWQTRWIIHAGRIQNGAWEYGTISLYGADVLLIFIFLLFALHHFKHKKIFSFQFLIFKQLKNFEIKKFLFFGLILTSFISIFIASDKILAIFKFSQLLLGIGLFWLTLKASYDRVKLIFALLAGVSLQAALAIWQFLDQTTFANKWLGLALHQASAPGTSVIEVYRIGELPERWLRAYGGFDHPNVLGGAMAVSILFLIGLSFSRNTNRVMHNGIIKEALWVMSYALCITALFFSFSRGAWLALLAGLLITGVGLAVKKRFSQLKDFFKLLSVGSIVLAVLIFTYHDLIFTRLAAKDRLEVKSTTERITSYEQGWQIASESWLSGRGIGNYTLALQQKLPMLPSWEYQPTHNVFLLIWSETGIFGLIFFLGILMAALIFNLQSSIYKQFKNFNIKASFRNWKLIIRNLFINKDYLTNNQRIVNIAILISILIMAQVDHWWWSLHFGILFLFLTLGLINSEKEVN